jgi:hypothetical protein
MLAFGGIHHVLPAAIATLVRSERRSSPSEGAFTATFPDGWGPTEGTLWRELDSGLLSLLLRLLATMMSESESGIAWPGVTFM